MTAEAEPLDLTGKLLIAMPGMGDPRFAKSVVFLCAHSPEGAMGLVVNQPTPEVGFAELLRQLDIEAEAPVAEMKVRIGGPVEHGRGFVLHSSDYRAGESTLRVDDRFGMTATLDILEAIAHGRGPQQALLALGYSGWGPGQLEGEIARNGWLTCDASPALVFSREDGAKWERALATLGIDPLSLSAAAGRA
jgi:putative transcriptional regulator